MKWPPSFKLVAAIALALNVAPASGSSLTIKVANNPPYTIETRTAGATGEGFFLDIVKAMEVKIGLRLLVHFMGWSDVQKAAFEGQNIIFFPYSRTPEREARFMWVQKLWDINEAFISGPGSAAIDSYGDGSKLPSVGVVAGSTGHAELTKRRFSNLRSYPNAVALTEALARGEVGAVYTADIEVKYAWRASEYPGDPVIGATQAPRALYIAASKDSPKINPADWARAYDSVIRDGTVERAYKRYFGNR